MGELNVELPEDLLVTTGQSRDEFIQEARYLLLLKLFEIGRISSGRAAEVCGMSRAEFLLAAGKMGVPVADLDPEEAINEFQE